MKTHSIAAFVIGISVIMGNTLALADEHDHHDNQDSRDNRDNHQYVHHDEWRRGARIRDEDWSRGEHIDYRERHLRAPPRGYEWRQVDGNYVLAVVATGVIASVIAATIVVR